MPAGIIVLVHGTGVRFQDYKADFDKAKATATANGVNQDFVEWLWGDRLGAPLEGLSIPADPSPAELAKINADLARWSWLPATGLP